MIRMARISKRFGAVTALRDVTLAVAPGERVAFVGANGSGKTTLLRALLGLVRVDGEITVAGADVAREPETALRSMAYIPQIAPPIEAPVAEVVRAASSLRGVDDDATWSRARRLGLDVDAARPKRFRDLSGGMKQKLLAAIALAAEAPVLVCDEPTANLDGDARAAFLEMLSARPRTSVVVLCSHRIEEVRALVDRVVEMSDGRVVRDAPLEQVLSDLPAFRVEVTLARTSSQAHALLRSRGFRADGGGRFVAEVPQSDKVALVTTILAYLGDEVADLAVAPLDLAHAERRSALHLVAAVAS